MEHFRIEYFKMLDATIQQLSDRILDCPGMRRFHELEAILLTGEVTSIASEYPELCDQQSLKTELAIFLKLPQETNVTKSLAGSATSLRNMVPEMRMMFPHVEALVRLLMINPASSASAERSFSSLRRLKSYLRSTCGQLRLNNIAMCNVHKDVFDQIKLDEVLREFILHKDNRVAVFGH